MPRLRRSFGAFLRRPFLALPPNSSCKREVPTNLHPELPRRNQQFDPILAFKLASQCLLRLFLREVRENIENVVSRRPFQTKREGRKAIHRLITKGHRPLHRWRKRRGKSPQK